MGTFYVTTPIYYVNDVPHIGHAYTTAAADVVARFHRQRGEHVFFLTGTDEHGNKVEQAATARGITPREHADQMVGKFKEVARKVDATNDFFIRTTDPEHEAFVQRFVERCRASGDIFEGSYSGLYCSACEAYYTEENLVNGLCPDHGIRPTFMEEKNYFFRLSAYQEKLAAHYHAHPDFVRPRHRYNEALSFIDQGLDDISISRATLKWGIPVPWDESQVIYVWVDALINYLSALHYAPGDDLVERFWPATYHMMAQDILKFHGIIWPALLMSAGYALPEHLFIHGYLKLGGEKMSKTRGNVMDPFPLIERYGPDPFRFYCFREVNFGQDGMVGEESFKARYNSELANDLGNLLSRSLSMIGKYRESVVPTPVGRAPGESPLAAEAGHIASAVETRLEDMDLTGALETIWELVRRLNRYVEEQAPWKQAKAGEDAALDATLYDLAEGLRLISVLLYPYMPGTVALMRERLGIAAAPLGPGVPSRGAPDTRDSGAAAPGWAEAVWGRLPEGATVIQGGPLFPRIEE
ncbi:MAG: methionine--tRNA ligase [Thermoleophilia bacterium]